MGETVTLRHDGPVAVITITRPDQRNAVDPPTALGLRAAFVAAMADTDVAAVELTGAGGVFCAGADLKAVAEGAAFPAVPGGFGPMGPTRTLWAKPVIAAVEGHAVAGGLELALMADLRVGSETAVFGVFCRRWGVPLIDGGTVWLPRVVGHGRAMDMILTGRPVDAAEALAFGLINRLTPAGQALSVAIELGKTIARFPQTCLLSDRASAIAQWTLSPDIAFHNEDEDGRAALSEAQDGAARFAAGLGRGGDFSAV